MVKYAILDRNNGTVLRVLETSEALANPPPNFILLDDNVGNEIVGKVYTEVGLELNTSTLMLFATSTINETTVDPEDTYTAWINTYEVGRGLAYDDDKLEYSLRGMEADISSLQTDKADVDHTHTEYVSASELIALEDEIDTKADASHTHSEYVASSDLESLSNIVDDKADVNHSHSDYALVSHSHDEYSEVSHSHSNYSETTHDHNDVYSLLTHTHTASEIGAANSEHNHDTEYADIDHNHDSVYAFVTHNHDNYADISHSHVDYVTTTALDELVATVSGKANASHNHDDLYYTETEIDQKLTTKSDISHNHEGEYDVSGSAAVALASANSYTDSQIDALVGEGAAETLNTIGEISSAIEDNQDAIDLLNSAIGNKANLSHTHTIANVANLQTTLDGKAASGHTHNGVYANANHSHTNYAATNHSHTASAVGAVATGDVATVSEVETYLGI